MATTILQKKYRGTLSAVVQQVWRDVGVPSWCIPVPEKTVVDAHFESPYLFGDRLREAVGDENAPVISLMGIYFCIGLPDQDWKTPEPLGGQSEDVLNVAFCMGLPMKGRLNGEDGQCLDYSNQDVWDKLMEASAEVEKCES